VKKEEEDNMKQTKRFILSGLLITACVITACTAYGVHQIKNTVKTTVNMMQPIDKEVIKAMTNENLTEETVVMLRDNWMVAAFGLDSREDNGLKGANSDVIMLINLNGKTGEIKLVSIYRDTCLMTGKTLYRKANSAYAAGGPKQAVAMLNENLDIKIDDYIAINWKAVANAINILGGVDLDVSDAEFRYINGFITETVDSTGIPSTHLKQAGTNHLDGVQAVAYCRLRLMDNDFKRTERQRKVLELLLEKAAHADWATLNQLIVTILPETASSVDIEALYAVAKNIVHLKKPETMGFPAENFCKTIDGTSYVVPDDLTKNVSDLHNFLYGTEDYKPSQAVYVISQKIRDKSITSKESKDISLDLPAVEESKAIEELTSVTIESPETSLTVESEAQLETEDVISFENADLDECNFFMAEVFIQSEDVMAETEKAMEIGSGIMAQE